MSEIIVLFLIGIALLASDVFVSSFILAAFGGAVMLAGCGVACHDFGTGGALAAVAVAVALLGATLYVELAVLPKTRFGSGLIVRSTSGDSGQPPVATSEVVGKAAVALTTLAPSGYVMVGDRRYEAFCQSGHASKGDSLRVVGLDNFRLIVSAHLNEPSQPS